MASQSQWVAGSANSATTHRVLAASSLKGAQVGNFAGEELGKVEDFVVDFDSGRIAYVILTVGGFLGIGDKLIPVPYEFFSLRPENRDLLIDVDKQMLLDAPSFERIKWPEMGSETWANEIRAHYAQKPYWNSDITDAGDYVGDTLIDKPDRDRV